MVKYLTDCFAPLLYQSYSQKDPLSEEDQEDKEDDEHDSKGEGEEDPGVAQLQQLLQEVGSPVHLESGPRAYNDD